VERDIAEGPTPSSDAASARGRRDPPRYGEGDRRRRWWARRSEAKPRAAAAHAPPPPRFPVPGRILASRCRLAGWAGMRQADGRSVSPARAPGGCRQRLTSRWFTHALTGRCSGGSACPSRAVPVRRPLRLVCLPGPVRHGRPPRTLTPPVPEPRVECDRL
jgi:hypothetical protein